MESDIPNGYVDFSIVAESPNYIHILVRNLYGLNVQHMQYLLDVHGIKILHSGHNGQYYGEKVYKAPLITNPLDFVFKEYPYEVTCWKGESLGKSYKED